MYACQLQTPRGCGRFHQHWAKPEVPRHIGVDDLSWLALNLWDGQRRVRTAMALLRPLISSGEQDILFVPEAGEDPIELSAYIRPLKPPNISTMARLAL